jgi:hypothetical protein
VRQCPMCDALSGQDVAESGFAWCSAQGSVKILDTLSARSRGWKMCKPDKILICMESIVLVEV